MLMFCLFCNLFGGVLVGSLLLGNVGVSPILFYEVQSDVGPVCSPKEICVSATLMLALVQMLLSIDDV